MTTLPPLTPPSSPISINTKSVSTSSSSSAAAGAGAVTFAIPSDWPLVSLSLNRSIQTVKLSTDQTRLMLEKLTKRQLELERQLQSIQIARKNLIEQEKKQATINSLTVGTLRVNTKSSSLSYRMYIHKQATDNYCYNVYRVTDDTPITDRRSLDSLSCVLEMDERPSESILICGQCAMTPGGFQHNNDIHLVTLGGNRFRATFCFNLKTKTMTPYKIFVATN